MKKIFSNFKRLSNQNFSKYSFSTQKFIFFFGEPGVGKGTYATRVSRDLKLNNISTGDEIRKILKCAKEGKKTNLDSGLVKEILETVNAGKLVSDEVAVNIIKEKLKEPESQNGVILDGFPRTLSQLQVYEQNFPIHVVVNIYLERSILLEKLMARRTCVSCGASFNLCSIHRDGYEFDPLLPKKEGFCDKCDGKLIIRDDDTEKVISRRMDEYSEKTKPLLNVFKEKGVLVNFEPKRGVNDYSRFLEFLNPLLNKIK